MTRDELGFLIVKELPQYLDGYSDSVNAAKELADRILLALNQERVEEVVLATGLFGVDYTRIMALDGGPQNIGYAHGKRGSLIFREQEGK